MIILIYYFSRRETNWINNFENALISLFWIFIVFFFNTTSDELAKLSSQNESKL